MIFWHTFINSLKLPNKQAMFKLNRTGMNITIIYMFILLFLVSLPILIEEITSTTGLSATMNLLFLIIYFFMFSYLPLTIIFFILLSFVAFLGTLIAKLLLHRRLRFSLLWKMSAYLTTIPLLVYTLISIFTDVSDLFLWLVLIYTLTFLIKLITIYPKRKPRISRK